MCDSHGKNLQILLGPFFKNNVLGAATVLVGAVGARTRSSAE